MLMINYNILITIKFIDCNNYYIIIINFNIVLIIILFLIYHQQIINFIILYLYLALMVFIL